MQISSCFRILVARRIETFTGERSLWLFVVTYWIATHDCSLSRIRRHIGRCGDDRFPHGLVVAGTVRYGQTSLVRLAKYYCRPTIRHCIVRSWSRLNLERALSRYNSLSIASTQQQVQLERDCHGEPFEFLWTVCAFNPSIHRGK